MPSIDELRDQITKLERERFKALRESGSIGGGPAGGANIGTREAVLRENKERDKQIAELEAKIREMQAAA